MNFQGRIAECVISDFQSFLLELKSRFDYGNENVTMCTIPPIPNILDAEKFMDTPRSAAVEQTEVNDWIISLANEGYNVIPLDSVFTADGQNIKLDMYRK